MAQVISYAQLYPYIVPRLPGCDPILIALTLKEVSRTFCVDTEAFRDELDLVGVTDYQQDYELVHAYDAAIHRILWVEVNGQRYTTSDYALRYETHLRFTSASVPHDLSLSLLTCATAGTVTLADWTAISDGSVTVSIDGSTYGLTGLDFTNADSFEEVAIIIQTALRDSISGNTGEVRWAANHFTIYNPGGVASYLTAGSAGTDISGAGYMNGLTGAGALAGALAVKAVFRPEINTTTLPNWFLDRWGDYISAGAMAELAGRPKMPYTDAALEAKMQVRYNVGWSKALKENRTEFTNGLDDFSA